MARSFFGGKESRTSLSIDGDGLRYLEIGRRGGAFRVLSNLIQPLPPGTVQQELLGDPTKLLSALEELRARRGRRFVLPVHVGLPSRDVMLRVVELPRMNPEDAREAFRWEFDKYFPFSVTEAVYDTCPVEYPEEGGGENMRLLVAAARLRLVELLLEACENAGMSVAGVEPALAGLLRTFSGPIPSAEGGFLCLSVGRLSSHVVVGYRTSGLLFRTLLVGAESSMGFDEALHSLAREVGSTITFAAGQFRNLVVDQVLVCGTAVTREKPLAFLAEALPQVAVHPFSLWDTWGLEELPEESGGWETAFGLAVKDFA